MPSINEYGRYILGYDKDKIVIICKDCPIEKSKFLQGNGEPVDWRNYTLFAITTYLDAHNRKHHSK